MWAHSPYVKASILEFLSSSGVADVDPDQILATWTARWLESGPLHYVATKMAGFFEQAVLDHQLSQKFPELASLRAQPLDLVAGRSACGIAGQPLLDRLRKSLGQR